MGKVEELIVGKDKDVRGVKLRIIYPLEVCGIENGDRGNPVSQGSADPAGNPNKENEGREKTDARCSAGFTLAYASHDQSLIVLFAFIIVRLSLTRLCAMF